jgi:hypothetical protein
MRVLMFWLALALLPVVALLWQHEVALSLPGSSVASEPASAPEDLLVLELGGRSPVLEIPSALDAAASRGGPPGGHPEPVAARPRARPGAGVGPGEAPASLQRPEGGWVVVAEGETLYRIAQRELGDGSRWREIAQHNGIRPGQEGLVRAGRRLRIPARTRPGR